MSDAQRESSPVVLWLYAAILLICGVAITAGGAKLVLLNGSPYYVIAGAGLVVTAALLFCRRRAGMQVFAAILFGTIVWGIWEAGLAPWPLVPRVVAPIVLGLVFLLPAIRRPLRDAVPQSCGACFGKAFALCGIAALIGIGLHTVAGPTIPPDPIYQRGMGTAHAPQPATYANAGDWRYWGADMGGSRFAPLDQITAANVDKLQVAWIYRTGPDRKGVQPSQEVTPLKVDRTVYVCTDYNDVIALDAESGKEKWRYKSAADMSISHYGHCRGLAYYHVPNATGVCAERIITNTLDAKLIALDAATGQPCPDFGADGKTDLLTGMGEVWRGYYFLTSPPTIVRGKIVLGGWVTDGQYWGEPSGVIRAYDVVTGKFAWAFDVGRPDRHAEPPEGESYTRSTPNAWAPMSADEELGLIYAPTGNATPDYYGAQRRPFDDEISSSVVAIDAGTGEKRWSFQTTHHDLWDYDVPSQPTLLDIPGPNGVRKALIQPTKRAEFFLLDRVTGQPIADVEERPVPQDGAAPGERISPTQPFSVGMPSPAGPRLTEQAMWGLTPLDQLWCRIDFRQARYEGPMTPPGEGLSLFFPGFAGGSNWGSVSVDHDRNIMIANVTLLPTRSRLMPRSEADAKGIKPYGNGVEGDIAMGVAQANTPYASETSPFVSPLHVPCTQPPYGTISAIDMDTQKLLWTKPFGTAAGVGPFGISSHLPLPMGQINLGGSLTTRSGLTFIAANPDGVFRAFDTVTGKEVWHTKLPVPAYATPMSYTSPDSNRQFIVISAAGFRPLGEASGDYIIAFALPK